MALLGGPALCACSAPASPPPPWASVIIGQGQRVSVDTVHIRWEGTVPRVWLRFDFIRMQPETDDGSEPGTIRYNRVEMEQYLDCPQKRALDIEMQIFDSAGKQVGRHVWDDAKWVSFAEHPASALYFDYACNHLVKHGHLTPPAGA